MGSSLSCKRKNLNQSQKSTCSTKAKTIKLNRNRKIKQTTGGLYRVIFDAEGFSVHDLALIGQRHSKDSTILDKNLKPKSKGRVVLLKESKNIFNKNTNMKVSDNKKQSASDGELKIVEILDYIDDLYLQLLDPDRNLPLDVSSSASKSNSTAS